MLGESATTDKVPVCHLHATPMGFDPNWVFSLYAEYDGIRQSGESFPNAKWGHLAVEQSGDEIAGVWYCPECETNRQAWIANQH